MDRFTSRLTGPVMAVLIALLSGLGIGSGGLLVIWLTMIEGIDAQTARGINLLFFVFSASAALLVHLLKGRVKPKLVAVLSLLSCIGTLIGVYIGARINPLILRKIFGAMLLFSGIYTLAGSLKKLKKTPHRPIKHN